MAIFIPFVFSGKILKKLGFIEFSQKPPLAYYQDKSYFIIRNDFLDIFVTALEHLFSKLEVIRMMNKAGFKDIIVSSKIPFWHFVGRCER